MFALVDCNNFFVSCERVFNPGLEGKPVIVLSNNDGCVISRSNEAKQMGIPMGSPFFKIRALVKQNRVAVFSANFNLYGDMSWRVMEALRQFDVSVEVYSIDEAFLDASSIRPDTLAPYGEALQRKIKRWTGIPVSVGIAKTKTLAKVANEIAKKSQKSQGVLNLASPQYHAFALSKLPVAEVWGVGYRISKSLENSNIQTALQLRDAPDHWILKRYSITLLRTVQELRGIPCFPLTLHTAPRQSISCSRSFGTLVETLPDLKEAVATYVARAAEKLRQDRLLAKQLTVYIRTSHFRQEPQYANAVTMALPVATDCSHELIQVAARGLEQIYQQGYRYYKARVTLTELSPTTQSQQNLFDTVDRAKTQRLMKTLDQLNNQWGNGTLKYAAEGLKPQWLMKREHRSPAYTTHWTELPLVKT